jgi:Glycosyl transferase family 2
MSDPVVSVVIACFNYAHTLPDAVSSVLGQTLSDFELTIVDDGSTDDSLAVARGLALDPRVSVVAQENSGQPAIPRNRAISAARGRFVVSLDADDKLAPDALAIGAATLDTDDRAGLAYPQQQDFGLSDQLHPHLDWSLDRIKRFNHLPSATMFRRAAWEAAGGYNLNVRGYEDWDLWLGIAEAGFVGRPAHGALWYYRKHGAGVYAESKDRDQALKAQVVVNRAGLYGDGIVAWARGVLAGDPAALALPHNFAVVPDVPDPPGPLRVARDHAERADWYVDADDLEGPWPGRPLIESLAMVDRLGYTRVQAGGSEVARKRGTDPRVAPIPFFLAGDSDSRRAEALAAALEDLATVHAVRGDTSLDAGRTAAVLGVSPSEVAGLVSEAQELMRSGGDGPVPVGRAQALGRLAGLLRRDRALAGDVAGAERAAALERAAARAGLEDARRIAILAFADELIADPSLLRAYGSAVSSEDDATLVIVTRDADALVAAVGAAGLDGTGSPDLLAVDAQPAGADAVFSRREHDGLPRYDETSLGGLQALVHG